MPNWPPPGMRGTGGLLACRDSVVHSGRDLRGQGVSPFFCDGAEKTRRDGAALATRENLARFSQLRCLHLHPQLYSALDRVSVLSEALPYLQRFRGKTIVVKYGGAAMKDPSLKVRGGKEEVLGFFLDVGFALLPFSLSLCKPSSSHHSFSPFPPPCPPRPASSTTWSSSPASASAPSSSTAAARRSTPGWGGWGLRPSSRAACA